MNKSDFTIFTLCQDLKIEPANIVATHDALNSFLSIPVKFIFRQPAEDMHFDIDSLTAKLFFNNVLLSSVTEYTGFSIDMSQKLKEKESSQVFTFTLSSRAIEHVEKLRDGDYTKLKIEFRGLMTVKTIIQFNKNGGNIDVKSLFGSKEVRSDLYLDIPQSQWVKSILPGLNYNSFLLVEVPLTHKTIKESYKGVVAEFVKAEAYFRDQNYYDCIGACRKAMDELSKNLFNFKEKLGSKSNYKWLEDMNQHTLTWINAMNKSNSRITSKPHHMGDHHFERYEAESIYLITLGLMNYIGSIE